MTGYAPIHAMVVFTGFRKRFNRKIAEKSLKSFLLGDLGFSAFSVFLLRFCAVKGF